MEVSGINLSGGFDRGLQGLQAGLKKVNQAASNIAGGDLDPQNFVDLMVGQRSFEANATVIRSQDELIGFFLDTFA